MDGKTPAFERAISAIELEEAISWFGTNDLEEFRRRGFSVQGTFDDPVLIGPDGQPVETWREDHPYDEHLEAEEYERTKRLLQIELLKAQT